MFLLFSTVITAMGQAGVPYNFFNIEKCYGNIQVRIYPIVQTDYSLINCTTNSINQWNCSCRDNLYILTFVNTTSNFSALIQYNIDKPKEVIPSTNGMPTSEELYNDEIKRIYTIKDIVITESGVSVSGALSDNDSINNFLLIVVVGFGILLFLGFIFIVVFWFYNENIRRWLRLEEKEKITFLRIIKRIFTRENIDRKTFVRQEGKLLPKIKSEEKQKEVKYIEEDNKTTDEIKKILNELNN
jgi:hypothetical protein